MKPNDRFSFVKNNRVSQDTSSMVQCYLPIIGQEALSLYLYAMTFWDGGQKEHLFAAMLNHLNFGMDSLLKAFKTLTAMKLVTLYQQGRPITCYSILPYQLKNFYNIQFIGPC
ncbi:replicative DNA helicase [Streptococcus infantis SK1302]|uniref:Replicative DNA helicase n=1 Tax=Streptococcus infantis SK1302 TaxID=871237 RepID=A0ABN0B6V1_9STRE|nr:replicative DNA helicase [Streptococcus infantis SK1302]